MFKNFFVIAWRKMIRNRSFSVLNIFGLAIGMTVALLIGLWVYYQWSYDRFIPQHEQVYSTRLKFNNNGVIGVGPATPLPLAAVLKREVPGVKYVAQADWGGPHSLVAGDKKIYLPGSLVSEDFLKVFPFQMINGNAGEVLKNPYSIVLTESAAKALFGNDDPINKVVRLDNGYEVKVTGILKDLPGNSTFRFNYLIPLAVAEINQGWIQSEMQNWRSKSFQTFVRLDNGVDYAKIEPALTSLMKKYSPDDYALYKVELFFQPMRHWHLYSEFKDGKEAGGMIEYVRMFSIIGIFVLLIACINFVNLSTANAEKRAREVGVRKAIGSLRSQLVVQFLTESIALTSIAFAFSLILAMLVLPYFNTITHTSIAIPFGNPYFWIVMAGYVLLTGLLAGSRPAWYLSSFKPVKVLKGVMQSGPVASVPRKILVVMQFTCSIALICGTAIVYQQLQHVKDRPKGYDSSRLLMTDGSSDLTKNYTALKQDLLNTGMLSGVTVASVPPTGLWVTNRVDHWKGKVPNEVLDVKVVGVGDLDYFHTLGMQLTGGRNFSGKGDSLNVILNEAAVKAMRLKQPLSQILTWHDIPQDITVVGVVKDAIMQSPFEPAVPTIFLYTPGWNNAIIYRLKPQAANAPALAAIGKIFNRYNPGNSFDYRFVDDAYAEKFSNEELIGRLAGWFSALAIFISCLGLFGLTAYMAERRSKEISIRKVLGASVAQVWVLLTKEFAGLVIASCVAASPLAYYFMQQWLLKYPYRISITPFVFVLAGVLALSIAIVTISFQAVKAGIANPVKSLRTE